LPRLKSQHVDDSTAVGRRLKEARLAKGLNQRSISFEGCSPSYISRIEAGQRVPSLQILRVLARRLDTSADYLATGEVPPKGVTLVHAEIALRLQDFEEAEAEFMSALADAVDDRVRSAAVEGLGHIALRRGDERAAIRLFEEGLALVGGGPESRPTLAEGLAGAHLIIGEVDASIALLERCAQHYRQAGDPVLYTRFAAFLAYALTANGEVEAAAESIDDALEHIRDIWDPYARARLYWARSRQLTADAKIDLAADYAGQALHILQATEHSNLIADALRRLAYVCRELGRPSEASELLRDGTPLIQASGRTADVVRYRLEQARAFLATGQTTKAVSIAADVAGIIGANGDGDAQLMLGEIFDDLGERERAAAVYGRAIELLEGRPPSRGLTRGHRRLAQLLKEDGRTEEALEVLERVLRLSDRTEDS
jgi:tetratricopeptide (TPR) repeat protein